jgi:hypothetical protein
LCRPFKDTRLMLFAASLVGHERPFGIPPPLFAIGSLHFEYAPEHNYEFYSRSKTSRLVQIVLWHSKSTKPWLRMAS